MEREYIERNAVLEEAVNNKAVRAGLADEIDIKEIINDVSSADVISVGEYQGLAGENRELKKLLKLAIEDIDNYSFCSMCVNRNDYDKCKKCKAMTLDMFKWEHGDEAEKLLKSETLAEFQPVVHARWEISSDGYYPYCKKCNARPENGKMTKYCPNCGAKMDGD